MSAKLLDYSPQYLRERAQQTRAMARTTSCDATLAMLETRAAEYDRMADLLENAVGPRSGALSNMRSLSRHWSPR